MLYIPVSHLGTEHVDVLAMAEHVVTGPAELTLVVKTVRVVDVLDIEEYQYVGKVHGQTPDMPSL